MSTKSRGRGPLLWLIVCVVGGTGVLPTSAKAITPTGEDSLPAWVKDVGARRQPIVKQKP